MGTRLRRIGSDHEIGAPHNGSASSSWPADEPAFRARIATTRWDSNFTREADAGARHHRVRRRQRRRRRKRWTRSGLSMGRDAAPCPRRRRSGRLPAAGQLEGIDEASITRANGDPMEHLRCGRNRLHPPGPSDHAGSAAALDQHAPNLAPALGFDDSSHGRIVSRRSFEAGRSRRLQTRSSSDG